MSKATKEVKIDNEKDNEIKLKKSTPAPQKRSTSTRKKTSMPDSESKSKSVATKTTAKKSSAKKSTTPKKKSPSNTKKTSTAKKETATTKKSKKIDSNIVAEYYDLPYRYNETIVKILYQTPTILFVYWDISDIDRENFIKQYGNNFFSNTKPILKIFNLTKNYSFEVEINDFANSWYINVNEPNCEYKVELGRRTIKFEENLNVDYIHISSSNDIEFPNDHILLDKLPNIVRFKNIKTNSVSTKDISTLHLVGINKIYNAHDFYKNFYKDEIFKENIINTSSSSWN